MTSKLIHAIVSLTVFGGLSVVLVALTWQPQVHADTAAEHEDDHADHGEAAVGEAAHEDTDHGAAEPLSPEELLKAPCEHEVAIIDCDECRYEAGVAKISPQTAQGLVEPWPVRTEQRATQTLNLTGEVQFDLTRVVEIASPGAGRVEQIHRNLGDTVAAGDALAVIQSSELGEAQAGFLEARARLDLARQTFEREQQLQDRKVSSQADYLAARSELASTEALLAAAHKRLQLFGMTEDRIETLVSADSVVSFGQLALVSPIAGTVTEQSIVRGQLVGASAMLYRIADLARVWVWCDLYESDLALLHDRIASGAVVRAEIHAGAFPQTAFRGVIDLIGSQLDRETRTLKVRVAADNPDGRLKPGMFVRATVDLDDERAVLRVPTAAVLSDAGKQFVFVRLSEELWIRRDVVVGPPEAGMAEVCQGLSDGEIVAAKGAFMFKSEILKEKMGAGCAH
ncbi:MAG: efflux RND transporter periplasmic adaptor subunit [Phycisphaerales bacterium]